MAGIQELMENERIIDQGEDLDILSGDHDAVPVEG
jgi:hypothetical protein